MSEIDNLRRLATEQMAKLEDYASEMYAMAKERDELLEACEWALEFVGPDPHRLYWESDVQGIAKLQAVIAKAKGDEDEEAL